MAELSAFFPAVCGAERRKGRKRWPCVQGPLAAWFFPRPLWHKVGVGKKGAAECGRLAVARSSIYSPFPLLQRRAGRALAAQQKEFVIFEIFFPRGFIGSLFFGMIVP